MHLLLFKRNTTSKHIQTVQWLPPIKSATKPRCCRKEQINAREREFPGSGCRNVNRQSERFAVRFRFGTEIIIWSWVVEWESGVRVPAAMGRVFLVDLDGRAYRCRFCESALALVDDVLSRVTTTLCFSLPLLIKHLHKIWYLRSLLNILQ